MPTQKEIAQFFRLALRFRLVDTVKIERWVDTVIEVDEVEPVVVFPFTDLAGASRLPAEMVDQLLGQVTGPGDDYLPGRMMFAVLRRRLRDASIAPESAIRFALEAGSSGAVTETEHNKADHLDDSVWLARNDNYGTLDEVRKDITAFFERYAEFDDLIPTGV